MNERNGIEQRLDVFLADDADRLPDRVIDAALSDIQFTDQRRPWRAPRRTSAMFKLAGAIAAALVVVAFGLAFTDLGRPATGAPTPAPSPSASQAATPTSAPAMTQRPQPTPFAASGLAAAGVVIDEQDLPAGSTEWLATQGSDLWIPGGEPGTLTRLDTTTDERTTTDLGAANQAVALIEGGAWATRNFEQQIVRVDTATNEVVQTIETTGYDPYAIAVDGDRLWATVFSNDAPDTEGVLVFDVATGELLHRVELGRYGTTGIAIGDGFAWVAANATGTLVRIDLATYEVAGQTNVGASPLMVAYGFDSAWVASRRSNAVYRVGSDGTVIARIDMPVGDGGRFMSRGAFGVAIGADAVWATAAPIDDCHADPGGANLVRIDPATNSVTAALEVACAYGVAAAEDGDVWVTGDKLVRVAPER
jgi:DNA-binding beta-propeller fold protein YncE